MQNATTSDTIFWLNDAGNRIAVVTTDAGVDAFVRDAFRHENYELITVANFAASQDKLAGVTLAIVHIRSYADLETPRFVQDSAYWRELPLFAITRRDATAEELGEFVFGGGPGYDMYYREGDPRELVNFVKRILAVSHDAYLAP